MNACERTNTVIVSPDSQSFLCSSSSSLCPKHVSEHCWQSESHHDQQAVSVRDSIFKDSFLLGKFDRLYPWVCELRAGNWLRQECEPLLRQRVVRKQRRGMSRLSVAQ